MSDFVKFVSDASTRITRANKFKMRTLHVGNDAAENSLKSSRLWKILPEKLCLNSNIDSFKSALKTCT
jgi:hypothetical protein